VLLPLLVSLVLALLGILIVAKVAQAAMRRLDLELFSVLLWLGLAEAPADELGARRGGQPSLGNSAFGAGLLYRAK
jgi:threonine/homoserine/homoserine lactone efflux protein